MKGSHRVLVDKGLVATMRDGVRLTADAYRPDAYGRFPTLVVRVPYGRGRFGLDLQRGYGHFFARHGYLVLIQDTRGRHESDGDFYPLINDAQDGYDTVEWAAGLPWSNGRVGAAGQSYYAANQYLMAILRPPHLVTCLPISAPSDWQESWAYRTGGALEFGWLIPYAVLGLGVEEARRKGLTSQLADFASYFGIDPTILSSGHSPGLRPLTMAAYRRLPIRQWGEELREIAPFLADYLRHVEDPEYWEDIRLRDHYSEIDVPVYHISSWYDLFLEGGLNNFSGIQVSGGPRARGKQKLLIGPWAHRQLPSPYTVPSSSAGDVDFGSEAQIELQDVALRWFDYWLAGRDNKVMDEPPVTIFVMGRNRWRQESDWPPTRAHTLDWHLHGNGGLSLQPAGDELPDTYIYNPDDPTPACGGGSLVIPNGAVDQRPLEDRRDVLVYTSHRLSQDLEITGPIKVVLYASSSAVDTDFVARMTNVRADGCSIIVQDGMIRARYRVSRSQPTLLKPGAVYCLEIDLWATSYLFRAGDRLRLDICSACFPRFDRNLNVAEHPLAATHWSVATQTVFHDIQRPSRLVVSVIDS